jgi:hypothetical protein
MAKGKADAWLTCNKGEEDNSVDQACKRLVAGIYIFEAVSTYCSAGIPRSVGLVSPEIMDAR